MRQDNEGLRKELADVQDGGMFDRPRKLVKQSDYFNKFGDKVSSRIMCSPSKSDVKREASQLKLRIKRHEKTIDMQQVQAQRYLHSIKDLVNKNEYLEVRSRALHQYEFEQLKDDIEQSNQKNLIRTQPISNQDAAKPSFFVSSSGNRHKTSGFFTSVNQEDKPSLMEVESK